MAAILEQQRSMLETKRLARLSGAVYAALGIATVFGFYHAPLVQEDPVAIARAISVSDLRFRLGVLSDVLATALSVPLVLLLYRLFAPVDKMLARLMAGWLLVATPMSFVFAQNYVAAHALLTGAPELASMSVEQRQGIAMLFLHLHVYGVLSEEIFWGLWLLPLGYLVIRSQFMPRVLGILLIVAAGAYILHSVTSLLFPESRNITYERLSMLARGAGEIPMILWLLVRGARVPRADGRLPQGPARDSARS